MLIELDRDERFLIYALREFKFLSSLGYIIEGITIYHRSVGVGYKKRFKDRVIYIEYGYGAGISIQIWGKRGVFSFMKALEVTETYKEHPLLSNLPKPDAVREEDFEQVLKQYAMFMQQQLLPIIKGTEWV